MDQQGPLRYNVTPTQQAITAKSNKAELMRWHYRLGHLSFKTLREMALAGEIPKKLADVTPQRCAGCLFGAMTKLRTRDRGEKSHIFQATYPGKCVSVDQMSSTEPGFFGQLKGKLSKTRYYHATVFVDHFFKTMVCPPHDFTHLR